MLEVAPSIIGADRTERLCRGLKERLERSGLGLPKQRLDLGEGFLDEPTTVRLYTRASSSGYTIILSCWQR
jgi:hypothetical protein